MKETGVTWDEITNQLSFLDGKRQGVLLRVLKLRSQEMPDYRDANMVIGLLAGCGLYDYDDVRNMQARGEK
jgi:hypothetical protein